MEADHGLGSWIRRRALAAPDDVALIQDGAAMTYAQMDERVRRLASVLAARGVGPGSRVAYQGPNHRVALESLFATTGLGAAWVPVLEGRPDADVDHIMQDSGAELLIAPAGSNARGRDLLTLEAADGSPSASLPPAPAVAMDAVAILGYTSGTTGRPKGAILTHANLTWNVLNMLSACEFGAGSRTLALAPFTRLGGLGVFVLETLFVGGTIVIPEPSRGLLDTVVSERITHLFANPAPLAEIAGDEGWEDADLSRIREGVVGGSMVPESLLRTYLDKGVPLRHGYGLTEAAPVVTLLDQRDALRKFGSVGKPLGLVDVAVDAPSGQIGEILVRGPNVISGYLNVPTEAKPEDWWRTGDAGRIDDEGFLYVVDRVSERMDFGDATLYPAEIEQLLHDRPGVADVAALADGVRLVLFLVRDPGEELRLPETIHGLSFETREVDAIPRNAAGKILRDGLRAQLDA